MPEQIGLYPDSPGYKKTNTSRAAAGSMRHHSKTLQLKCLELFHYAPWHYTADEIAKVLGMSLFAIRPRITELAKLKKIKDTNQRRKNESGRFAIVWTLA